MTKTVKAYKGLPMEGVIATWYARTTLKDLNRHKLMAGQLVKKIPTGGHVLEIAPGPPSRFHQNPVPQGRDRA